MSSFETVNEENFAVQVLKSSLPVVVDFGAEWCGPCKRLDPILEKLNQDWDGKVRMVRLDVDMNAGVAAQYQVMSLPTLILFKGGKEQDRLFGLQSRERIIEKFSRYF
jgi:thioredoxin 1